MLSSFSPLNFLFYTLLSQFIFFFIHFKLLLLIFINTFDIFLVVCPFQFVFFFCRLKIKFFLKETINITILKAYSSNIECLSKFT